MFKSTLNFSRGPILISKLLMKSQTYEYFENYSTNYDLGEKILCKLSNFIRDQKQISDVWSVLKK